jgi:hypothetical protein
LEDCVTLNPQDRIILDTRLVAEFVPHLPALFAPRGEPHDAEKNLARSFAGLAVSALCGVSPQIGAESVTDDFDDFGLDAVYYDVSVRTLFFVQAKLKESAAFTQREVNDFAQGVRKIISLDFSGMNQNLLARQVDLTAAYKNCSRMKVVIAEIGSGLNPHARIAIDQMIAEVSQTLDERLDPVIEHLDGAKALAFVRVGHSYAQIERRITLHSASKRTGTRNTYVGFMPIADLVQIHTLHGEALFARNIRNSLGVNTPVNAAITRTLDTVPTDLEYLSNGVTILARSIAARGNQQGSPHNKEFELSSMTIINGAQTVSTATSHFAAKGIAELAGAFVPVTLIEAGDDADFGKKVTQARNHQNQVDLTDFVALHDEQERLRQDLRGLGFDYVYKSSERNGVTAPNKIYVEEAALALALLSDEPRHVVTLKRKPSVFRDPNHPSYQAIFTPALTGLTLVNSVIATRVILAKMAGYAGADSPEFSIYQQGNFAMAHMIGRRLRDAVRGPAPFDPVKVDTVLSAPLDALRQAVLEDVQGPPAKDPAAVFGTMTNALGIMEKVMIAQFGLAIDPVIPHKNPRVSEKKGVPSDPYNVPLHQYLAEKAPQIGGLS